MLGRLLSGPLVRHGVWQISFCAWHGACGMAWCMWQLCEACSTAGLWQASCMASAAGYTGAVAEATCMLCTKAA
jgi:hypothetical protein